MKLADRIEDWHYRLWHWFDQACANIILGPELSLNPSYKIPVSYDPPRTVPVTAGIPVETAVTAASPGASRDKDCDFHEDPDHECEDWWGDVTSAMCRLSRTHRMLANFYAHHGRDVQDIIGGTKY